MVNNGRWKAQQDLLVKSSPAAPDADAIKAAVEPLSVGATVSPAYETSPSMPADAAKA